MTEAWEQAAPQQRLNELMRLLEEQKSKEIEHDLREDAREKRFQDRNIEMADLIETLAKHILHLEKRVSELEKRAP